MNKPNSEALRRGLYVGAVIVEEGDKQQHTINRFDEDGDPEWGDADGAYALNCTLVPGQQRRFQIGGGRMSVSTTHVERFLCIEVPEAFYDEALAVLAAHFEEREAAPTPIRHDAPEPPHDKNSLVARLRAAGRS